MRPRPPRCAMLLLALTWGSAGFAQEPAPIRFGLSAGAEVVRPGAIVQLTLTARIPRGWHLYGMQQPPDGPLPTTITAGPDGLFTLAGAVISSPPQRAFDPNFGMALEWHDDPATFRVPVRAARTALPGTYDAQLRISYQRCNDRVCLPLTTDTLRVPLTIAGSPEPQATSSPPPAPSSPRSPGAGARDRRGTPGRGSPAAAAPGVAAAPDSPVAPGAAGVTAPIIPVDSMPRTGDEPPSPAELRPEPFARWLPLAAAIVVVAVLAYAVPGPHRRQR